MVSPEFLDYFEISRKGCASVQYTRTTVAGATEEQGAGIFGLKIMPVHPGTDSNLVINLPTCIESELPDVKDEIALQEDVEKISEIRGHNLSDRFPSSKDIREKSYMKLGQRAIPTAVLIGRNCPEAMLSKLIEAGDAEKPYVYETALGTALVGAAKFHDDQKKEIVASSSGPSRHFLHKPKR